MLDCDEASSQSLSYSFSRDLRLRHKSDSDAIFRKGHYRGFGLVAAKFLKTEHPTSRFMISVKKRAGSSPCRNRIKRLLREAIRLNRFMLEQNYDICFMVTRPPQRPVSFKYMESQVTSCFCSLNDSCLEPPSDFRNAS